MGGPSVMVTRLGRMSSHHEGASPSTDLSTRRLADLAEIRRPPTFGYTPRFIGMTTGNLWKVLFKDLCYPHYGYLRNFLTHRRLRRSALMNKPPSNAGSPMGKTP